MMTEGKRQKQVAAEISKELNEIFLKHHLNMLDGGMVSISDVKMTPDLQEARIYLSFFQIKDESGTLDRFKSKTNEIRRDLGNRMRHQLRTIPHLTFFIDDTLDHVFKIEKLLADLKKKDDNTGNQSSEH